MITAMAGRLRAAGIAVRRMTMVPLVVRAGVLASALTAMLLAYPAEFILGRGLLALLLVAALPAVAPRRVWPTVAVLVAMAGWVLSTGWYDRPVELWRLIGLAATGYLTHSLAALAALLPYDAVVAPEVPARWLSRALGVVLAAAVAGILLLTLAGQWGDRVWVVAAVAGLAVVVLMAGLLGWLSRR